MKKGFVAAIVIFGLIVMTGSATADNNATPPRVINASANPPVIAINTGITELRVDAAGIDSPIDVVTVDLSPIGGNATTVMPNIGNYTKHNITWTMYNYTTNASVDGTFNLMINATDINGNYNDTVNITLDVKKAVIQFSTEIQPMTSISNITFDAMIPDNVGKNATIDFFKSTEVIDNVTYFVVNRTKPIGGTKWCVGLDVVNEDTIMKRVVTEVGPGVEANLTFDPAFVMFDFPLWVGKTWTTTINVTGRMIVNETGVVIPIDSVAVVSGEVTDEVDLTVPYGTIPCLVVEINCSYEVMGQPTSALEKHWVSQMDQGILFSKSQSYLNGILMGEFELIEVTVIPTE